MLKHTLKKILAIGSLLIINNVANSATPINAAGGSTIYLRGSLGSLEYSLNNISWTAISSFPITINSLGGNVQLNFESGNFSIANSTQYIINNITGSDSLNISYTSSGLSINNDVGYKIGTLSNSANLSFSYVDVIQNAGTSNTINNTAKMSTT